MLEARATVRLYKDLVDERGAWHQRVAAALFHQGVPAAVSAAKPAGRAAATQAHLSPAGRQTVDTGLRQTGRPTAELDPLRRQLEMYSRRQCGCAALRRAHFGIGAVTSVAIWAELGDVRRFTSSDDVVRHTGLDITVHSSDAKRPPGKLSRQGPPLLRWARLPPRRTGLRLLHRDPGPARRRAGHLVGGPQAGPPLLPHPARARRGGTGPRGVSSPAPAPAAPHDR